MFEGEHVSAGSLGLEDQVFIVSGVSKSYAMTGWRIGYLVCPPDLAEIAGQLQGAHHVLRFIGFSEGGRGGARRTAELRGGGAADIPTAP